MKDLIIKNAADIKGHLVERDGNKFYIKPVVADKDVENCEAAFVEVPVGNYAFGYHFHDQKEEIFYVVSGKGKLRTFNGNKDVKTGDMLCFPTGEKGSHVLTNTSKDEPLVFIDFGAFAGKTDICILPDTNMAMLKGNHIDAIVPLPKK